MEQSASLEYIIPPPVAVLKGKTITPIPTVAFKIQGIMVQDPRSITKNISVNCSLANREHLQLSPTERQTNPVFLELNQKITVMKGNIVYHL